MKNNNGKLIRGWSWTPGRWETTTMPSDKEPTHGYPKLVTKELYVQGGPFYYNPELFGRWFFLIGFRPTSPWAEGYADEGILGFVGRWTKRHGFGNLAITRKKTRDRHRAK